MDVDRLSRGCVETVDIKCDFKQISLVFIKKLQTVLLVSFDSLVWCEFSLVVS